VRSWVLPLLVLAACGGPASDAPTLPPSGEAAAPIMSEPPEAEPSAAALAAARVRVEIVENLDSELRAVLSTEARRFRTCYAQALDRNPELTGTMSLDVHLTEGRPTDNAAIQVDETGDWRLVACVEDAVRDWAVPGAADEELAFVLRFSSRAG
jgi:hypothetical protein